MENSSRYGRHYSYCARRLRRDRLLWAHNGTHSAPTRSLAIFACVMRGMHLVNLSCVAAAARKVRHFFCTAWKPGDGKIGNTFGVSCGRLAESVDRR